MGSIGGDGIGSIIIMTFTEIEDGITRIELQAEIHYGHLEHLFGNSLNEIAKSIFDEDIKSIEQDMMVV